MRLLACAVLIAAFAVPRARAQDDGDSSHWDARITAATGEVVVHPKDGSSPVDAAEDMPLAEGDRVVTSAGASAEIALDGGSLITLSENSDFTLTNTQKSQSAFTLAFGSLLAKIQKLGTQSLSIRSPTSVAAVRGTEFGVDVDVDGGQSHVGVFDEGRVEVGGSGATEILTPNQETSVARGHAPMRASALRRFAGRRQEMRARVARLAAIHANWKRIPAGRRRLLRRQAINRGRQNWQNRRGSRGPSRNSPGRRIQKKAKAETDREREGRKEDRR